MSIDELRRKREGLKKQSESVLDNMQMISDETLRVAEVAGKSREIIDNIEAEFERQTGFNGVDIAFLFFATALQCARIYIINKVTKIEPAGQGNTKEDILHKLQDKLLKSLDDGTVLQPQKYYAPLNQIIYGRGVPYDATAYLSENYGLFKGANHRFATLGHDPILGLIFGTANILTNTITCVKAPLVVTNHVVYDSFMKNPKIAEFGMTTVMLKNAVKRVKDDKVSVVAAIIKQIIHIGTDMYTPCGIQMPGTNLVLSNKNAEMLTKYISMGDILKISASAEWAVFINFIISTLHMLLYDEEKYESRDVYCVKTRKILMYSNLIATSSNVIITAVNAIGGNEAALKDLDIGGLIVTIHRLITDIDFIQRVKEEFVFGKFKQLVQGEELELKEIE
jgi:hypothetical protein